MQVSCSQFEGDATVSDVLFFVAKCDYVLVTVEEDADTLLFARRQDGYCALYRSYWDGKQTFHQFLIDSSNDSTKLQLVDVEGVELHFEDRFWVPSPIALRAVEYYCVHHELDPRCTWHSYT